MAGTILIAVEAIDQIEKIVPQLKNAVQAETRIGFLIRYPVNKFQLCGLSDVDGSQPEASAASAVEYSPPGARKQLPAACEALSSQGVNVAVDFYAGSTRKAIRKYTAREHVQLTPIRH